MDGGDGEAERLRLIGGQGEIGERVAGTVDPVARGARLIAAEDDLLQRHALIAELPLVPLEGRPPGRVVVRVLPAQFVGDLIEGERNAGLEQEGHQVGESLQRVGHADARDRSIASRITCTTSSALAPGVSTPATPSASNRATSGSGMMPPTTTGMSDPRSRTFCTTLGTRVMCAPDNIDRPMASTS